MRIGGSRGESPAAASVRQRALRNTRKPIFGVAMIAPLVFAGAVSAAAPSLPVRMPPRHAAVTPVAAVSPTFPDLTGPAVVEVTGKVVAVDAEAGTAEVDLAVTSAGAKVLTRARAVVKLP